MFQQNTDELRPVPGFEGRYSASFGGRVWSHSSNKWLRPSTINGGYLQVQLGRGVGRLVARLVAEAWHGPPPPGREFVNHIDGVKTNNRASNLEWCDRRENMQHALRHGLHVALRTRKLTPQSAAEYRARWQKGEGLMALAREAGVHRKTMHAVVTGRSYRV